MTKAEKTIVRDKLVDFGERLGYKIVLDSQMESYPKDDEEDGLPAGYCNYFDKEVHIRHGKGLDGQISTLIHELAHALGLGGNSWYTLLGEGYVELACESVTQYVTQIIGIERTHKVAPRIVGYGFGGLLATPVTQAVVDIFCDQLGYEREVIKTGIFIIEKKEDTNGGSDQSNL